MDRRKFIKQTSQITIAAGLAAITSYLIFRKKSIEVCEIDFACKNCSKASSCQLPEANKNNTK